jgi:hypothetical protein
MAGRPDARYFAVRADRQIARHADAGRREKRCAETLDAASRHIAKAMPGDAP